MGFRIPSRLTRVAAAAFMVSAASVSAFAAEQTSTDPDAGVLRFYLVRHGQTLSNIKEMTIGGGGNAQLTHKGRYDASSLGLGLGNVQFIAAYSSTLGRAYETANAILRSRPMPVTQIDALKDISWGEVEGGRIDDLTRRFGHSGNDFPFYFGTFDDPNFTSPVKAENMFDFSRRFEGALKEIAHQQQGKSGNILVTAHSSMAFYLQKYRADKPLAGLSNTSVSVLEFKNGQFSLRDFNNTQYLKDGYVKEQQRAPLEITLVINPMTVLQKAGVMEGTTDSDFTADGAAANQKLHKELENKAFIAAYSSELVRGYKSAEAVLAGHNVTLIKDKDLNEIFLGQWEAENVDTIKAGNTQAARDLFSDDRVNRFQSADGGEDGDIAAWRFDRLLSNIGWQHEFSKGEVAVFTHPLVVKAFLNRRIPDFKLPLSRKAQVIRLQYKNETFSVKEVKTVE